MNDTPIIPELPTRNHAYVDSNVILRYLTGEPAGMAEQARTVFAAASKGQVLLLVPTVTLAEVVWVLDSVYKVERSEIATQLIAFINADGVEVERQDEATHALSVYRDHNVDFTDAVLAARCRLVGPPALYSFDRDFDRLPGVERRAPGEGKPD